MELTKNKQKILPAKMNGVFPFTLVARKNVIADDPSQLCQIKQMSSDKEEEDEDEEQKIRYGKIHRNWKRANKCEPETRRESKFIQYGNMIGLSKFWHVINNKNQLR